MEELLQYYEQEIGTAVEYRHRGMLVHMVDRWGPDLFLFCIDQAATERDNLGTPGYPRFLRQFLGRAARARGRLRCELRELDDSPSHRER